jgi:hypothetical protein
MRKNVVLLVFGASLITQVAALAAKQPVAVSPGDAAKLALIENRCPTFSWGSVAGAKGYESTGSAKTLNKPSRSSVGALWLPP